MRRSGPCRVGLLAVALFITACARPSTPAGGAVPETPLRVADTRPGPLDVVDPFDGPVEFRFQRTLSEQVAGGSLRDAVVVSPRTGDVDVQIRGQTLRVSMDGGLREPRVYRFTVLPRFRDRYGNTMEAAFDLFFSTAGPLEPNLVAGLVEDRLTLEALSEARVDAVAMSDEVTYSTVTDDDGIFAFPYLPSGEYTLVAYEDLNRNRTPDFPERQDSMSLTVAHGDTVVVTDLAVLAPDTTAAVLQQVTAVDSMTLRITFDDYLDPAEDLSAVEARLVRRDEPGDAPDVLEVLHPHAWEPVVPDSDAPNGDDVSPPDEPPDPDPAMEPEVAPQPNLPEQDLVLLLSEPLVSEVVYILDVGPIRNINGVDGGGGEAEVEWIVEPEPEPEPDPDVDDPPEDDLPDGMAPPQDGGDDAPAGAGNPAG